MGSTQHFGMQQQYVASRTHCLASLAVSDCCSSCTRCCAWNSCSFSSSNSCSTSICAVKGHSLIRCNSDNHDMYVRHLSCSFSSSYSCSTSICAVQGHSLICCISDNHDMYVRQLSCSFSSSNLHLCKLHEIRSLRI